jgi:hypothetical protein
VQPGSAWIDECRQKVFNLANNRRAAVEKLSVLMANDGKQDQNSEGPPVRQQGIQ